jgi:hypothetical protein
LKKSISPAEKQDEAVLQITARYVEQVQSGQKPCLSDYLDRYPDHKDAIVDFVAYYHALEEHIPQRKDVSVASKTLSEVSQLALEYVWQRVCLTGERWPRHILTLLVKKDNQHLSLSYLASELDLSADVVMQLEQRRIDPVSIPLALSRHLAQVLQQPLHVIQAYFAEDNQYGAPGSSIVALQRVAEQQETYSALSEENVPRVSFRQVLEASGEVSERQKALWRAIIERENI